jgi:hypothetical protein
MKVKGHSGVAEGEGEFKRARDPSSPWPEPPVASLSASTVTTRTMQSTMKGSDVGNER